MTPASAPPGPALLEAESASLRFPSGLLALDGVDLSLRQGEFATIVGPSGCGKSTFLRLCAGLLDATGGSVRLGGEAPRKARGADHPLAFVFQQAALPPWRRVWRNVALPLELEGAPRAGRRERCMEALRLVGLGDFADAYPHELSGGMQMRVSLARALVTKPSLLLLDEPFGALDEITRQRLNEELLALWQRDQWGALFITHNVFEAVFLSQRVLVMSGRPGRIAAEIAVPFAYPREAPLRATAEFAALAGEVASALEAAH